MKYFAVFAILALAVVVVVNADGDNPVDHADHDFLEDPSKDHCGVVPDAKLRCNTSESCYICLAGECYGHALNNDCVKLKDCVTKSECS